MSSQPHAPDSSPAASKNAASVYPRFALLLLLIGLGCVLAYLLWYTPRGQQIRQSDFRFIHQWVEVHRNLAPFALVCTYVLFGTCLLPVWWIQISAGYCFGFWYGLLWCEISAVIGAILSLHLSRWMLGEWFWEKYERRMVKLQQIDQTLGHNGLLVVMSIRLAHVMPFGISNYLFGLTRITTLDVGIGTGLGGSVAISFYVAVGVGRHILKDWRYWTIISAVNLLLLVPLILRYLFPDWFKRVGIE